jgi:hypothetical protein
MIFNIFEPPREYFRITAPNLNLSFPASCPQVQPQSGREEETRIVALATHRMKSSVLAKVVA